MDAALSQAITAALVIAVGAANELSSRRKSARDARERAEVAAAVRTDVNKAAASVAQHVNESSKIVAEHSTEQTLRMLEELQKNTDLSVVAFTEANSVNAKIAALAAEANSAHAASVALLAADAALSARIDGVLEYVNRKLG